MNYPLYREQQLAKLHYQVRVIDEDGNVVVKGRAADAEEAQGLVSRLERYIDKHLLEEYEKEETWTANISNSN